MNTAPKTWVLEVRRPPPPPRTIFSTGGIPAPSAPAVIFGGVALAALFIFGAAKQPT